ncbi:pectinesterase family protein [Mangrovibacterium diazotrophicum]|uniref:Pectin methylesterase-like acyl-CoA thioesterase n=1 Tax=Mangrovibacterium diazotrophicum TaxID=1261403 RepID=A0A419W9D6_9BACT|nr:pectinesterase family protein [Mangrovibacterium diazotrophicum]RKD92059.1 pectin methylesterase-like acyl-CoA thioesterase [Mangrovibacterium diazotrophicum]
MKFSQASRLFGVLAVSAAFFSSCSNQQSSVYQTYPANGEKEISPDTHLKISFKSVPEVGATGMIRVYDWETDALVDSLDLSIPSGPTEPWKNPDADYTAVPYEYKSGNFTNANTKPGTPSGTALPTPDDYQLTIIGGFTDGFHFYPIIVHDSTATIYLHHNLLQYNKRYYVLMDSTVIRTPDQEFKGVYEKSVWNFTTREQQPDLSAKRLVVDDQGNGDFNTLQGALDFIPDNGKDTITIFLKNGVYEELIYFRNKSNLVIQGESRDSVIVQYANSEVFNPHPWNVKTNEWLGTFPSRRAAFAIDNCSNIQLMDLTVKTLLEGQAEGLLINGDQIQVRNVFLVGSGDALQTNGSAYFENVTIDGGGDMVLGRGPAFFKDCEFYSPGPFMWIRNTDANHGNVFVNCRFHGTREGGSTFARAPTNQGKYGYPFAEAVLINCAIENIRPEGWGQVGDETKDLHYWEFNSTNITDGSPADVSQRAVYSKQLNLPKDEALITNYSTPSFVLGGWMPVSMN